MKPATKVEVARLIKGRRVVDMGTLKRGEMVVFASNPTATEKRAAAGRLLKGMPRPAKPGQKPAHELVAEYRASK